MKKIYTSIAMLALTGGVAMAQVPTMQNSPLIVKDIKASPSTVLQNKALGTTVWSDDFSTPSNWTIDNSGESAPFGWGIDAVNDSWAFTTTSLTSTSGGNYAELYNGDPTSAPAPLNTTYSMTTATSIDVMALAGTEQVMVQFEQYGAQFQDLQEVQVSTDGNTFFTVGSNSDIEALTAAGGAPYANPMLRSFDISSFITGASSTVWIRFRWSPGVQTTTYGWFIDDVAIVTKADNDLQARDSDWGSAGLHYYMIPEEQIAPIEFWATASNEGINDQTNSILTVDVNTGAFTGTSAAGVTITPTSTDSLVLSTPFTPSAAGAYSFTWGVSSDQTDDTPANNDLVGETFNVGGMVYARDANGTPGTSGGEDQSAPGSFAFEAGSMFDIFTADTCFGIDVVVGTGTPAATLIYGKLYELDATGNFVFVDETAEYEVNEGETVTMVLFSSPVLTAGTTYMAVVGCYSEFMYGTSGFSPDQTSFIMYPTVGGTGGQYFTNGTPMVRMNFDGSVGVKELKENGVSLAQNMPNPFNANSTINFEIAQGSNVTFEFTDVMGRNVKSIDMGTLAPGAHSLEVNASEFANGIYYYTLRAGQTQLTSKMVVKK